MKIDEQFKFLKEALKTIVRFAPVEFSANMVLSVLQGVTAGVGALLKLFRTKRQVINLILN